MSGNRDLSESYEPWQILGNYNDKCGVIKRLQPVQESLLLENGGLAVLIVIVIHDVSINIDQLSLSCDQNQYI